MPDPTTNRKDRTMPRRTLGLIAAALFLGCIVAANYVTTHYGLISVGFGLTATAGTYFAGATFVLRDTVQDCIGRAAVFATIAAGAALSVPVGAHYTNAAYLPPGVTVASIVVASAVAFLCSETADWLVYTPLRSRGYVRAATASNIVGTVVDTAVFLAISGFGLTNGHVVAGQLVGKLAVTAYVLVLVAAARAGAAISRKASA